MGVFTEGVQTLVSSSHLGQLSTLCLGSFFAAGGSLCLPSISSTVHVDGRVNHVGFQHLLCLGCSLETGTQLSTPSSCHNSSCLSMDAHFYRGFRIPALEQPVSQGLSTAQLSGQWYGCIQGWMALAGVPCLSSNPAYHCLAWGLVYFCSRRN